MPELPEVEVTRQGLIPLLKKTIIKVDVRNYSLRWPIDNNLKTILEGQELLQLKRRAKYILAKFTNGTLIIHLGMSGRLCIVPLNSKAKKHDHVDFTFNNGGPILRYTDPRRFGSILWTKKNPMDHNLLRKLGPEPLDKKFNDEYLYRILRGKQQYIKNVIMNSTNVVGIGNIYASESLFYAGIKPQRRAERISRKETYTLVKYIKEVISNAIKKGGSTMSDFFDVNGENGYFQNEHKVYGREGLPCFNCQSIIKQKRIGQRSSFFCGECQK
jgi:formamidopyrimidine-DNA glycosylase